MVIDVEDYQTIKEWIRINQSLSGISLIGANSKFLMVLLTG